MIFKKEKEKRKKNSLLYQRLLANKYRGIKEAENQYSFPIRLECEVTEEKRTHWSQRHLQTAC